MKDAQSLLLVYSESCTGLAINEVITLIINIVKVEKKNTCNPKTLIAARTIKPSISKITNPIFREDACEINCANKSVPPVLVLYRSISPTPTPIKMPPNNTLEKTEGENCVLKGANQSIKADATINPIKLL